MVYIGGNILAVLGGYSQTNGQRFFNLHQFPSGFVLERLYLRAVGAPNEVNIPSMRYLEGFYVELTGVGG